MQRLLTLLLAVWVLLVPSLAAPAPYRESAANFALESRVTLSPLDLVSQLSTCAVQCLVTHSPAYGCSVLDIECQCASDALNEALSTCMVRNCTLDEAIGLAKVDAKQCNRPTDSRNHELLVVYWVFSVFIYVPFGLRMVSRAFITKKLWWDDFFHFVAIIITTLITYCVGARFGNHLAQVQAADLQTFWMWSYIGQLLWATSILSLKVSVLCFYLRLFPDRKFKLACSIVMGIMVVGATAFIMLDVLQCIPISAGWTLQHDANAKCIKLSVVAISGASFNVLSEIAIFSLPMPILAKLQMGLEKKIGVIVLLGLGVITIIIAVIRIKYLTNVDGYADSTHRLYPAFLWTALEVLSAHFVVSAPSVSALAKLASGHLTTAVRNSGYLSSKSFKSFENSKGSKSSKISKKKELVSNSSSDRHPPAPGPRLPTPPPPRRQGAYDAYGGYDFSDDDDDDHSSAQDVPAPRSRAPTLMTPWPRGLTPPPFRRQSGYNVNNDKENNSTFTRGLPAPRSRLPTPPPPPSPLQPEYEDYGGYYFSGDNDVSFVAPPPAARSRPPTPLPPLQKDGYDIFGDDVHGSAPVMPAPGMRLLSPRWQDDGDDDDDIYRGYHSKDNVEEIEPRHYWSTSSSKRASFGSIGLVERPVTRGPKRLGGG